MDFYEVEELEQIMLDGKCDVECKACGEFTTLEPDGHGPCPECGASIESPLVEMGMI